jgi:hypothetical protein
MDNSQSNIDKIQKLKVESEPKDKDEREIIFKSRVIEKKKGLVWEQVRNGRFVTLIDGEITYKNQIESEKYIIIPLDFKKEFGDIDINLPIKPIEYGTTEDLYQEIRTHLDKYVITSKWFLDISGRYIMITWVTENLKTISYLKGFGDWGSGKSRWEDIVGDLCYKKITFGAATNPAPIYRMLYYVHDATIAFDELAEKKGTDLHNDLVQILNSGIQRNKPVPRCSGNDNKPFFYSTFGPKLVSTRIKTFDDIALDSRFIDEEFRESSKIPIELPYEYEEELNDLQGKLLMYKLINWNIIDRTVINNIKIENTSPRVKQIFSPYFAVFKDNTDFITYIINIAKQHNMKKINQASESPEGSIVKALWHIKQTGGKEIVKTVTHQGKNYNVLNTSMNELWKKMKEMDLISDKITAQQLGYTRSNQLHIDVIQTSVNGKSKQVISWDDEKMESLKKRYIPENEWEGLGIV